ncbi:hypothetical protein FRX31_023753 [Thalictrum thalictroides]|uniref:Uncharacterized protein n=1 Tax=Thalictrum thalictroides TaxID=46969 RepID=A0A7J6VNH6_THATH|nr:hypothetical protein FRX31_023753 [Thalictrum thalictroides]
MISKFSGRGWSNLACDARNLERGQAISPQDEGKEIHSRHLQIKQVSYKVIPDVYLSNDFLIRIVKLRRKEVVRILRY